MWRDGHSHVWNKCNIISPPPSGQCDNWMVGSCFPKHTAAVVDLSYSNYKDKSAFFF